MGANYVSFNAPDIEQGAIRKRFEQAQEQDRWENGHSYSGGIGMAHGLRFIECDSFCTDRAADDYLMDHAEKWAAAIAVKVKGATDKEPHWRIGAWCSC